MEKNSNDEKDTKNSRNAVKNAGGDEKGNDMVAAALPVSNEAPARKTSQTGAKHTSEKDKVVNGRVFEIHEDGNGKKNGTESDDEDHVKLDEWLQPQVEMTRVVRRHFNFAGKRN